METAAERVKKVRISKGLSQKDFAKQLEITQSVISDIENERRGISRNVLLALGTKFNINATWVLTGEGEMFLPRQISAFKEAELTLNNVNEALIKTADLSVPAPEETAAEPKPAAPEESAKRRANTAAAITMLENAAQSIQAAVKLLKESIGE